jgi:hypothetical protein
MRKRARRLRPSPAMIVAVVALIAALGGTAIAGGVLNKKKVNNIISNRASGLEVKSAKNADKAADADKLGGLTPSSYQQFCKPGTIKGTLVMSSAQVTAMSSAQVTALPSNGNFQNVTGFNCGRLETRPPRCRSGVPLPPASFGSGLCRTRRAVQAS